MSSIAQFAAILTQHYGLELRVIEKNGIYIVQSNFRCGLISNWDDERKFKSKVGAEKYRDEWYCNYKSFKESENRIEE